MLRTARLQQLLAGKLRRGQDYVVLVTPDFPRELSQLAVDEHLPDLAPPTEWMAARLLGGEQPANPGPKATAELVRLKQIAEHRPVVLVSSVALFPEYLRELNGEKTVSPSVPSLPKPTRFPAPSVARLEQKALDFLVGTKPSAEHRQSESSRAPTEPPQAETPAAVSDAVPAKPVGGGWERRAAPRLLKAEQAERPASEAAAVSETPRALRKRRRRSPEATSAKPARERSARSRRRPDEETVVPRQTPVPTATRPLLAILDGLDEGFEELRRAIEAMAALIGSRPQPPSPGRSRPRRRTLSLRSR